MSNYGPAFFISRRDKKAIAKQEEANLAKLVQKACKQHQLSDDRGNPVEPRRYRTDKNAVSFLIYSSEAYSMMPEEAQEDQQAEDQDELKKVEAEIEKAFPKTYVFESYYVED